MGFSKVQLVGRFEGGKAMSNIHYVRGVKDDPIGTVNEAFVAASSPAAAIERFRAEQYGTRFWAVTVEAPPTVNCRIQFYA